MIARTPGQPEATLVALLKLGMSLDGKTLDDSSLVMERL